MAMSGIDVEVKTGDALAERADILVLKHAQGLYGLDKIVTGALLEDGRKVQLPKPWKYCFEDSVPGIAASRFLFVGVPPLHFFGYGEIRTFSQTALAVLAKEAPQTRHILLTVHGPGYGLDEIEAFEAELAGLVDAVRGGERPKALQKITIIERSSRRAERLLRTLVRLLPDRTISVVVGSGHSADTKAVEQLRTAGYASDAKAHVFVAMPFKDDMDDIYHYGIQSAVNAAGFLCERADLSSFTGDVLEWIRSRIRSASLVVADLTDANPNVYLEVGYAWGVGVPTVLIMKSTDSPKFDVQGQRRVKYKNIKELEDSLTEELRHLKGSRTTFP